MTKDTNKEYEKDYEYAMEHPQNGVECSRHRMVYYHPLLGCPYCGKYANKKSKEDWSEQFEEIFLLTEDLVTGGAVINKNTFKDTLKSFIENLLEQSKDEARIEKYEFFKDKIRQEVIEEVKEILESEITLAHTSESGKTSRLSSSYMRICKLI